MIGITYAIIAAILWGFDYAIAEKVYEKYSIYTSMFLSFSVGVLISAVIGYNQMKADLPTFGNNVHTWLLLLNVVITNVAMIFIALSIKESNVTLAGLIKISYPIFIIIFSYLMFRSSHLNYNTILGGVFIFIGIIIISIQSNK